MKKIVKAACFVIGVIIGFTGTNAVLKRFTKKEEDIDLDEYYEEVRNS